MDNTTITVAELLGLPEPHVSAMPFAVRRKIFEALKRMEADGLVERSSTPDGRTQWALTEKGTARYIERNNPT